MNTRILKAIDEVKIMLDTYNLKRDTTRIKEILYSLEHIDNYDELLIEVNDIGDRYAKLDFEQQLFDFTDDICWIMMSIIEALSCTKEQNICLMEQDIIIRKYYFDNYLPKCE